MSSNLVQDGDCAILDINHGERLWHVKVNSTLRTKVGSFHVKIGSMIGHPWGTVFEVAGETETGRALGPVADPREQVSVVADAGGKDNRHLVVEEDTNNQTMTKEELDELKASGVAGEQIILELAKRSETFKNKTDFAQEKYLKKKAKKYAPRCVIRRPSARLLGQLFYANDPRKISNLRVDNLALMLNQAHVASGARVLCIDMTAGLLSGAVLERIGREGACVTCVTNRKGDVLQILRQFNFTPDDYANFFSCQLNQLIDVRTEIERENRVAKAEQGGDHHHAEGIDGLGAPSDAGEALPPADREQQTMEIEAQGGDDDKHNNQEEGNQEEKNRGQEEGKDEDNNNNNNSNSDNVKGNEKSSGRKRLMNICDDEAVRHLCREKFTSAVICAPSFSPTALLKAIHPLMEPSASFSCHAPSAQPLAEAQSTLSKERIACGLQVQETWWREYQVLPMRTHPHMNMSGCGGFTLCGTFVDFTTVFKSTIVGDKRGRGGRGGGGGKRFRR